MNRSRLRKLAVELQASDEKNLVAVAGVLDAIKNYLSKATRGLFFDERYRFQKSNETLKVRITNMQGLLKGLDKAISENNFGDYIHQLTVLKSEMQDLMSWMSEHRAEVQTVQDTAKDKMNAEVAQLPPEQKKQLQQEIKDVKDGKAPVQTFDFAPGATPPAGWPDGSHKPGSAEQNAYNNLSNQTTTTPEPSKTTTVPAALRKKHEFKDVDYSAFQEYMQKRKPFTDLNGQLVGTSDLLKGLVEQGTVYIKDDTVLAHFLQFVKTTFQDATFKVQFSDYETIKAAIRESIFKGSMQRWSVQTGYGGDPGGRVYTALDLSKISNINAVVKIIYNCRFNSMYQRVDVTKVFPQIVPFTTEVEEGTKKPKRKTKRNTQPEPDDDGIDRPGPAEEPPVGEIENLPPAPEAATTVPTETAQAKADKKTAVSFDHYVKNPWFKKAVAPQRFLVEVFGGDNVTNSEFAHIFKVALRQNHGVIANVHTNGLGFEVAIPPLAVSEETIVTLGQEINKALCKVTQTFSQFSVTSSKLPRFKQLDLGKSEQFARMFRLAYAKKVG